MRDAMPQTAYFEIHKQHDCLFACSNVVRMCRQDDVPCPAAPRHALLAARLLLEYVGEARSSCWCVGGPAGVQLADDRGRVRTDILTPFRLSGDIMVAATAAITAALLLAAASAGGCPCGDPSLCRPLSPMPKPKDEVVAFPAYELYGAGYNETEYTLYDWSKITTIAPFEPLGYKWPGYPKPPKEPWPSSKEIAANGLYCTAHRHGVKVLQWSETSYNGTGCGATGLYGWCRSVQSGKDSGNSTIFNSTAVSGWAKQTAACIVAQGFDGIMLDMEGSYTVGRPDIRAAVAVGETVILLQVPLSF